MVTSKGARRIADIFSGLAEKYPNGEVDMDSEWFKGGCGCHASWYLVGTESNQDGWVRGADKLSADLGFPTSNGDFAFIDAPIERWADEHPEIWGNDRGMSMFCSNEAFGLSPEETLTLRHIANHWSGVAQRLKEKENELV